MLRSITSPVAKLLLVATVALIETTPARAGFLDTLFGRPQVPVRQIEAESDPLSVTVRKRAAKKKPAIPKEAPAVVLQKPTLDSSKDPYWYLKDETLRRGDIVVLPNRVLVLRDSSSTLRPGAFDDIRRSPNLSNRERARILSMTQIQAGELPKYKIVPDSAFTASATASQIDRGSVQVIMP